MTWLRVLILRLMGLFQRRRLEWELDEELRCHLQLLVEDNVRKGMPADEALHAARRSFGGVDQTKEAYRDLSGLPKVETLVQDLRFGLRMLIKNPGFTAVAVLTLALGIGGNTAIFSLIDAVMLQALPVENPEQLVVLSWVARNGHSESNFNWLGCPERLGLSYGCSFSHPAFEQIRTENRVFRASSRSPDQRHCRGPSTRSALPSPGRQAVLVCVEDFSSIPPL